jgi:hypothetical protein
MTSILSLHVAPTGNAETLGEVDGNQPVGGSYMLTRLMRRRELVASVLQWSGYKQRLIPVGRLITTVGLDA